jgi:hypothetical protein
MRKLESKLCLCEPTGASISDGSNTWVMDRLGLRDRTQTTIYAREQALL